MKNPCAETRGGRCHHLPVVAGALWLGHHMRVQVNAGCRGDKMLFTEPPHEPARENKT